MEAVAAEAAEPGQAAIGAGDRIGEMRLVEDEARRLDAHVHERPPRLTIAVRQPGLVGRHREAARGLGAGMTSWSRPVAIS